MMRPIFAHIATSTRKGPAPSTNLCGKPIRRILPPGLGARLVCGRCSAEYEKKATEWVVILDAIYDACVASSADEVDEA